MIFYGDRILFARKMLSIIKNYEKLESIILSDCWKAYNS